MKRNEIRELHTKTIEELERQLKELNEKLHSVKHDFFHGKLTNVNLGKTVRKDMARVITILEMKKATATPVITQEAGKEKKNK